MNNVEFNVPTCELSELSPGEIFTLWTDVIPGRLYMKSDEVTGLDEIIIVRLSDGFLDYADGTLIAVRVAAVTLTREDNKDTQK